MVIVCMVGMCIMVEEGMIVVIEEGMVDVFGGTGLVLCIWDVVGILVEEE